MACYVVASIDVTDPEEYAKYASQTVASAEAFGGRFLVKGGAQEVLEGAARARTVVVEFPDRAAIMAWYNSPGYQAILPIALGASQRTLVVVDGV